MHFDRLDFSGDVGGSESDDHAGLDDTSLNTTDGHSSDTTNFVDILEGETEGFVGRSDRGLNGINSIEEGLALDDTSLGLLGPALVPRHAECSISDGAIMTIRECLLGGLLQHVITVPAGNRDKGNGLGVVTNLLDEG